MRGLGRTDASVHASVSARCQSPQLHPPTSAMRHRHTAMHTVERSPIDLFFSPRRYIIIDSIGRDLRVANGLHTPGYC